MRLSLAPQRNQAPSAAAAVKLVRDETSPLPESSAAVESLARRTRGHISQFGSDGASESHMPHRKYPVRLAKLPQELVGTVRSHSAGRAEPTRRRRWRKPQINVLRGAVFAVAFASLVLAASVSRT